MKITIGIPFYNAEKYLYYAVKSTLAQVYEDFELILSDDGSTDRSLEIAHSFPDPRIKIITDEENRGLVYRLNEQLAMAGGEYFGRMDADDIMFPDRLSKQLDYLESHPSVDIIGSDAVVIDSDNRILGLRKSALPAGKRSVMKTAPFIHPSVMGRTAWFRKFYYNGQREGFEDADLWIRSYNSSKFEYIHEPLIFYRDPLKIKLSTYLYRLKQARQAYRNYRKPDLPDILKNELLFLSYFKSGVYSATSLMGMTEWVVAKRNMKLDPAGEDTYSQILSGITIKV